MQKSAEMYRIGILVAAGGSLKGLRESLRDLGYIEGRNVMQRCILHFIDWIRAMSDDALVDAAQEIAEMRPLTDTEDRKG